MMDKVNLTVKEMSGQAAELLVDGHTVRLHFAAHSPEGTLDNLRQILLNAVGEPLTHEKRG
jgi:hypothetical protein